MHRADNLSWMETLGDRVRAEREARGWSQAELAKRVVRAGFKSMSQPGIRKIESGDTKVPDCRNELAAALGVSLRWLQEGKGDKHAGVSSPALPPHSPVLFFQSTLPEMDPRPPESAPPRVETTAAPPLPGRPDIPVWASAEAGANGAMVLINEPIDWIRRSEKMQGVRSPFAFYVIGSSMSPAIEHGEQVVINPSRLPTVGKDHVFLQTQEDGTILALVKRLVRNGATAWRVRQFNPERELELPKTTWSKAYMISEKRVD